MISFSIQIEPHAVLEVAPGASLQEIRDAYRRQAKKFHPDTGGADWAFRLVAQAYEVLSTARVEQASRTATESETPFAPARTQRGATEGREGEHANLSGDPSRRVGVEKLWVRYESEPRWLRDDTSQDEHSLSCSLNFKWPDPSADRVPIEPAVVEKTLGQLAGVFEALCVKTRVDTSRIRINEDTFTGWVSYSSVERASEAFRLLHELLTSLGLSVNDWNRDLLIPRAWH